MASISGLSYLGAKLVLHRMEDMLVGARRSELSTSFFWLGFFFLGRLLKIDFSPWAGFGARAAARSELFTSFFRLGSFFLG
jgi:hypothetical protein